MIIACPACETRFLVDDDALGGGARRLRCANCGNLWLHSPAAEEVPAVAPDGGAAPTPTEPVLVEPAAAEPAAPPLRAEPREADEPPPSGAAVLPGPREAAIGPPQSGHSMAAAGLIAFAAVVLAALAIFGAVTAHDSLALFWDKAKRNVLAQSDVRPPPPPANGGAAADAEPGPGLKVTVNPSRTADALVIAGDIVNGAAVARPVPRLRLTLRDANKGDLASKIIDPPVGRLAPGATTHFSAVFEHPSAAASKVDVTFATD